MGSLRDVVAAVTEKLPKPRLITSSTNGYDGSMMNGLQSIDQWRLYFNNPRGSMLGLLNAIQVSLSPISGSKVALLGL